MVEVALGASRDFAGGATEVLGWVVHGMARRVHSLILPLASCMVGATFDLSDPLLLITVWGVVVIFK